MAAMKMLCPFCDARMRVHDAKAATVQYICPGRGPLLTKESGPCPYQGRALTQRMVEQIAVALIDLDMDD